MSTVRLLFVEGCPNWQVTDRRLRELQDEYGFSLEHHKVETPEEAERVGFRGSPTVLIDGIDPFAQGDEPFGLACRVYATPDGPDGSPTVEQLRSTMA